MHSTVYLGSDTVVHVFLLFFVLSFYEVSSSSLFYQAINIFKVQSVILFLQGFFDSITRAHIYANDLLVTVDRIMLEIKFIDHRQYKYTLELSTKKIFILFILISLFLIIYLHIKTPYRLSLLSPALTSVSFSNDSVFETHSPDYYSIPMPCIEPHCHIQCLKTYETDQQQKIIHQDSLTKFQREHLMIDLGEDTILQQLINSVPPTKQCIFERISNISIRFYPILFGFIDIYFPQTRSRQILINNQIKTVEQICLPRKSKAFSYLIPGKLDTYKFSFENELDYRRVYSSAYFAITMKKGGWDCNRHYEILTSGTIPFFDRLNQSGQSTLALLPKSLLYEVQNLQGVNRDSLTIDFKRFDINQYNLLLHRLLYYAKHRLTTEKIVEYILKTIEYPLKTSKQQHSILYIAHRQADYMKDFMLHGFTKIFEDNLHVYQPPRYLYQYSLNKMWSNDEMKSYYNHKLYGFGYGYKLCLKAYSHLYERDHQESSNEKSIENKIKEKKYSLIVFGSILREHRFYSLVKDYYEQSKVVLIDGEDEGQDNRRKDFLNHGIYFLREIPDDCRLIL